MSEQASQSQKYIFMGTLVEMGFDQHMAEAALIKTENRSVEAAIDWIMNNPDGDGAPSGGGGASGGEGATGGETSGDTNEENESTSEPVEAPIPLTEEEKKQKADELQERLNQKRIERIEKEKKEQIEREKNRRVQGREMGSMKEQFLEKQFRKDMEVRRREKAADLEAKRKIKEQIAADKAARLARANKSKNEISADAVAQTSEVTQQIRTPHPSTQTNTRLQFRLPDGKRLVQVFESKETLSACIRFAAMNCGLEESGIDLVSGGMPPKKFKIEDHEKSLTDLDLVPSAVIMVQKKS